MTRRKLGDSEVKLALIHQIGSCFKWSVAAALLAWFFWLAKGTLIEMSDDSHKPPWERVTTLIVATFAAGSGTSFLLFSLLKWAVPVVKRRLDRMSKLEQAIDPGRTSSDPKGSAGSALPAPPELPPP
jgi:choline-glycine betaine transporter